MKIKMFDSNRYGCSAKPLDTMEQDINDFLDKYKDHIIEIKYTASSGSKISATPVTHCVLVVYKEF